MFFQRIYAIILISILSICPRAYGQFFEDFSNEDLTGWVGDLEDFSVNPSGQLQLNASEAGAALILHPIDLDNDTLVWQGYLYMDFAPSNANKLIYYLYRADTLQPGPAIYLEIGENGGEDAIRLVFVDQAGLKSSFLVGDPGSMAQSPAEANWELTGTRSGQWNFTAYYNSNSNPASEQEIIHPVQFWPQSGFTGPRCIFTATRKDRFFFDDLYAGPVIPDTVPPLLDSLTIVDSLQVRLVFSEAMDKGPLLNATNYEIFSGPAISDIKLDTVGYSSVLLTLTDPLENTRQYLLSTANLLDLAGNGLQQNEHPFEYYRFKHVEPYNVIFTEVMADPVPPALLPDAEFLEVHNRTDAAIPAHGWVLQVDDEMVSLPDRTLFPGEYVILCDPDNVSNFIQYGSTWTPDKLPALRNSGAQIFLYDNDLEIIDQLVYRSDQHTVPDKSGGGWSLVLSNESEPCFEENWKSSPDSQGGSPGRSSGFPNSGQEELLIPPLDIYPLNAKTLLLRFHSKVLPPDPGTYPVIITPQIPIEAIGAEENGTSEWTIFLQQPLDSAVLYDLAWSAPLTLCNGRKVTPLDLQFGLPKPPSTGDLIINEVLFDPIDDGSDYVELKNVGDHPIDLKDILLRRACEGAFEQVAIQRTKVLLPGRYLCLTDDIADIQSRYPIHDAKAMIHLDLPGMNNNSGCLSLLASDQQKWILIDSIYYEDNYHHPLLNELEGVSLERLNESGFAINRDDWTSAAASVLFGTPARQNSNFTDLPDHKAWYKPLSGTFSPDGDGFEDLYRISIRSPHPAGVLYAAVLNLNGQRIHIIEDNILIGSEHLVTWDGHTGDAQYALPGPYIVHVRLLFPDGKILQAKMISVLASGTQ